TSTGEFGSMLQQIFESESEAKFEWLRWATLRGKRAHVYTYHIPQPNSHWQINYERRQEIVVGYSGLIYVDRDTGMILKVTLEAGGEPLIYVGTYTADAKAKGIYAFRFQPATGTVTPLGLVAETPSPAFLAIHPNRRFLYAANEHDGNDRPGHNNTVSAFAID